MGLIVIFAVILIPFAIGIKIFLWCADNIIGPILEYAYNSLNDAINSTDDSKGAISITYVASEQKNAKAQSKAGGGVRISNTHYK